MKLKSGFILHDTGSEHVMVSADSKSFNGLVRFNATAAFIVEQLRQETTPEKIVDAMTAEYDAPRETIEKDVAKVLDSLRSISALEE